MNVYVKLFAAARERIGGPQVAVEVVPGSTIGELRLKLISMHPEAATVFRSAAFAVDRTYVGDDFIIEREADFACIPPVSGG